MSILFICCTCICRCSMPIAHSEPYHTCIYILLNCPGNSSEGECFNPESFKKLSSNVCLHLLQFVLKLVYLRMAYSNFVRKMILHYHCTKTNCAAIARISREGHTISRVCILKFLRCFKSGAIAHAPGTSRASKVTAEQMQMNSGLELRRLIMKVTVDAFVLSIR